MQTTLKQKVTHIKAKIGSYETQTYDLSVLPTELADH